MPNIKTEGEILIIILITVLSEFDLWLVKLDTFFT